jgi:hypothetical protein
MTQNGKKNRLSMLIIFALSVIPFMIAWMLKGNPLFIEGRVNKGQLIEPVITSDRSDLVGIDSFSADNIKELQGHWIMLNMVAGDDCDALCREAIYKTKQLLLMMNKDLTRIRRAVLFFGAVNPNKIQSWLHDDKVLLRTKPSEGLVKKLLERQRGLNSDGALLLMDPLGNIMMQYPPGFDPYKVKSDLSHLLRISQIG